MTIADLENKCARLDRTEKALVEALPQAGITAQKISDDADILSMNITIHRDDVSYGPYTIEQVKELVAKGRLGRADLACIEGQAKWQPLENVIIQDSFRRQRAAYIADASSSPNPKKKDSGKGGKHANRWLWRPE